MSTTNSDLDFPSLIPGTEPMSHGAGELLEIACSAGAPTNEHGEGGFAALRLVDEHIAHRKRTLLKRNRELELLNEEKSELLAKAAHDLRNPVGNIVILTELLLEEADGALSDEQKELLQQIQSCSEHTQRLLDSVFALSVIESDSFRLSFELRDVQEILERVVSFHRALAKGRDIQIALCVDGPVPRINLDPIQIEQVFDSLVGNAIKYSPAGAHVEVRVRTRSDGVHVSVQDDGPGIPPQDLETLFTPFQKTRARATQPSSGLALAIAKRVIKRHGGQIWAESVVGLGSTFHVRLPIFDVSVESESPAGISYHRS